MNIIVTGGAGFIGSHLTERLLNEGHRVLVIDDLSTGRLEWVHPRAEVVEMDIRSPDLSHVFRSFPCDVVYHAAAQVQVHTSLNEPVRDARINIEGSINLLEAARHNKVGKIVYSSSAAVYGTPLELPISEAHPVQPSSCYGISKSVPEAYLKLYADLYGLNYTILRYANVYGPRQEPRGEGGVVSVFLTKLMNGGTAVIHGDGQQTRDFIYVQDIVEANLAALARGGRGTFNIGTGQAVSIVELLSRMSELLGVKPAVSYQPPRQGDIPHSVFDIEAAGRLLDWSPRYSLTGGLQETLAFYSPSRLLA